MYQSVKSWLDPKMDFIFKTIFTDEEILIDFLNAVLKREGLERIIKATVLNTETKREFIEDKYSILDIKAVTEKSEVINIEIQNKDEKNMIKRTLYHWSKMFSEQLQKGQNYRELNNTICINILNFDYLPETAFHNCYRLSNVITGQTLDSPLEIHFVELKKYERFQAKNGEPREALERWLSFLNKPESVIGLKESHIQKAVEKLEILSNDKETRELYLARKEAQEEGIRQINSARSEGIETNKINNAINLLDVLDDETIAKKIELELSVVKELRLIHSK